MISRSYPGRVMEFQVTEYINFLSYNVGFEELLGKKSMMSLPHMLLQLQGVVYKGLPGVEILVLQYYLTSLLTHQNLEE